VNDLLIAVNNVKAGLHHIHPLIYAMTHGKDSLEHLHEPGVSAGGGGGGTTVVGSVSRSHIWRKRSVMASWFLRNYKVKWLMCTSL
jgi:hypothetical protein